MVKFMLESGEVYTLLLQVTLYILGGFKLSTYQLSV